MIAQTIDQQAFTARMNAHITKLISSNDNITKAREKHVVSCDSQHAMTEEDIKAIVAEEQKHAFIQANIEEYKRLYFPKVEAQILTDTFICDNGGFENDFQYYRGYVSTYSKGSSSCTPLTNEGVPITWTPVTMPVTNRFEIMTPGTDPLVGIQQVKFGSKSLRINNKYGHISSCGGNYGIDRVVKRFKITEENRSFTVWYAVALENPTGHVDQQPFLNIKCDKAPADELCFDADFLKCGKRYYDPICNGLLNSFDTIDVVDWACHQFTIPASEIGNIATLEMIVADCGQGAHFGYAYIDGICEPCTGSTLGSINLHGSIINPAYGVDYFTCDGLTAKVCGSYTLPKLCGMWELDTIIVPGYTVQNVVIDRVHKTFCFEFLISNFTSEDCLDVSALITYISSIGMELPAQSSNTISICKDLFTSYDYDITIGDCNDNNTDDNLSDDYYYVTVDVTTGINIPWTIVRRLQDPYPGESGEYVIKSGIGSTMVTLGPLMIQEGCWDLILNVNGCEEIEEICPPDFCSGCSGFEGLKISNIQCISGSPDTWSFDIFVPISGLGSGNFNIVGVGTYSINTTHTINVGSIALGCKEFTLQYGLCTNTITVCPPLPCSVNDCRIEAYISDWYCINESSNFNVKLFVQPESDLCYTYIGSGLGGSIPSSGVIGPFNGNVAVKIYKCGYESTCFKWIYVPKLPCTENTIGGGQGRYPVKEFEGKIDVVPNPIEHNILTIHSDMPETNYRILNIMGQTIMNGIFKGGEEMINFNFPNGLYYIGYKDLDGRDRYYKFMK